MRRSGIFFWGGRRELRRHDGPDPAVALTENWWNRGLLVTSAPIS